MAGVQRLKEIFGEQVVSQELSFEAVTSELFGKLGYKDGKRFMNATDDPQLERLMRRIQSLEQELANKRNPELDSANAALARAKAAKTAVETIFGATQAAGIIVATPETAPVADEVLKSAGFSEPPGGQDIDLPQPEAQPGAMPAVDENTSPLEPAIPGNPAAGVNAGIEGGDA